MSRSSNWPRRGTTVRQDDVVLETQAVTVLDGGLSTALEQQGVDLNDAMWTARLLAQDPSEIVEAHRAFYASGAQVATSASYQATIDGFVRAGYDADTARRLIGLSVTLAQEARDELADSRPGLLVAASVGPYGAFLADGSEYRGRYGVSRTRLREFHAPRLQLLAETAPDLFAVETIPDTDEAEVLVELLDEVGLPAWFSYSVRGSATCAGQPLSEAYAVLAGSSSVFAAGVNCSDQEHVLEAVETAVAVTGLPAVAYPNKGGSWDSVSKTWSYGAALGLDLVDSWIAAGARYVGGCCGTGPADITVLAQGLAQRCATGRNGEA
jgi:homocysteine S-methyltransferase